MRDSFAHHIPNVLVLDDFFDQSFLDNLVKEFEKSKGKEVHSPERFRFDELSSALLVAMEKSAELRELLECISGKPVKKLNLTAHRFKHGHYTLLNDDDVHKNRLEFFITLGDSWKHEWGGSSVYAGEQPLVFAPKHNTFVLLVSGAKNLGFVKYINHFAEKKSFIRIQGIFA